MSHKRRGLVWLMRSRWFAIVCGGLVTAAGMVFSSSAGAFRVGDLFPSKSLQDQYQASLEIDADTKSVYVVSTREQGDWMAALLSQQPANFLSMRQAVYVADMSAMPGFVRSMFVLPALKQLDFRVAVVTDEAVLLGWQGSEGAVVQYLLENGKVIAIEQHSTLESLQRSFGLSR